MSGYNSTLGVRVRKLELASDHGDSQKIYPGRIMRALLAAGTITPDMMVVCRMIVSL